MKTCFVIQPFDGGKFDKRYIDVFKPAIIDAKLEPYRVDHDPSVSVPIDEIQNGIQNALICLADISVDNPNVWFELGYAIASRKPVVMVCSSERIAKFPFDVQHRSIIKYGTESSSDFDHLRNQISLRIKATLEKEATLQQIASEPPLASVSGFSHYELMALAVFAGEVDSFNGDIPVHIVKQKMKKNGFTDLAANLAIRNLYNREMIESRTGEDNGYSYTGFAITPKGWVWIENNESKFTLTTRHDEDDDVPF